MLKHSSKKSFYTKHNTSFDSDDAMMVSGHKPAGHEPPAKSPPPDMSPLGCKPPDI